MKIFKFSIFFLFVSYIFFYIDSSGIGQKIKWVSIVFLLVATLFQFRKGFPKTLVTNLPIWIFLLFFNIFGLTTSLYASEDLNSSITTLLGLNLYFLIFHFATYIIKSMDNGIVTLNKIIIITSAILVFLAFVANLPLTLSQFHTYFFGRIRVYGIFQHPNYLGGVCFVSLVACFINLKLATKYKKTLFFTLLFLFVSLILSDSRGGLYSFIIFLTVYYSVNIVKRLKNRFIKMFMFFFITTTFVLTASVGMGYVNSLLGNDKLINTFTSGRVDNWRFLLDNMILNNNTNFLFGHGLSSVAYLQNIGLNTDNGFLVWLYEAGILNFITVISLMLFLFFKAWRNKDVFSVAIFCSYITYAFFENFLMNLGHVVAFFCWLYIFINFNRVKRA